MRSMNGQPGRSPSGDLARSTGFAAAKGMALVGLAVVIGIILLQVVDDGSAGPVGTSPTTPAPTATTAPPGTDTTSTTAATSPARSKEEVRVLVLNGGAPAGSAVTMSTRLKAAGYVNQPVSPTDDTEKSSGNVVMCRAGFDQEATDLAIAVGTGTQIKTFRSPAPPSSGQADCVVIVGSSTSPTT
jgi:hypothetical protein